MSFRGTAVKIHQLDLEPPGVLRARVLFVDATGIAHGTAQSTYQVDNMPPAIAKAFAALVQALEADIHTKHFTSPAPGQGGERDVQPRNILEQFRDDESDGTTRQG